jgi:F0F1-type ATP synthase assembly protein I
MAADSPSEDKLSVAKEARKSTNQAALALELPFILVGTVALGVAIGFYMDRWLDTKPIITLILGALGFAGGLREIMRRV